jgi:hypothetical protein
MSCCLIQACRALLSRPEYVLFEAAVRCLSIAQCALVLEQEPQFVPQARPCGRTVLKSRLRWSVTWWRGAAFCHHRPVDRWVLIGRIDRFPIVMLDHADSSGFIVWISPRANPDDRVVINRVLIGGRTGLLIGFVVACCLTTAWNVVVEVLRPRWNSMVIMHHSSWSWAGRLRSSSSSVVNQDRCLLPSWMTAFRTGIACRSETSHSRSTVPWDHQDESQRFPPSYRAFFNVSSSDI